jgi:hypothetical protein
MKKINYIALLFSAFVLAICGSEKQTNKEDETSHQHAEGEQHHEGGHLYACPMHPEITGKEGQSCSKCGMALEHNDNAGKPSDASYFMEFKKSPDKVEAGKECTFSFTPKIKGKETEPVPLDIEHEKKIHLIIVSEDLSYFEHIHPEYKASGDYEIKVLPKGIEYTDKKGKHETKFENAGNYILFADYKPTGGNHTVDKINLIVSGNAPAPKKFTTEKLTGTSDDYSITLEPEGGKFITGGLMHISAVLKNKGKKTDANSLGDYLGAKAHMVVIGLDEKNYLHVHPNVKNGSFDLHTTFEKPGTYRGWIQFKAEDTLHTLDFVIIVKEGTPEEIAKMKKTGDDMKKMKM